MCEQWIPFYPDSKSRIKKDWTEAQMISHRAVHVKTVENSTCRYAGQQQRFLNQQVESRFRSLCLAVHVTHK